MTFGNFGTKHSHIPSGCITGKEASLILGISPVEISAQMRYGKIESRKGKYLDRYVRFPVRDKVILIATMREKSISHAKAAALLGVSAHVVRTLIRNKFIKGVLVKRAGKDTVWANRADVLQLAAGESPHGTLDEVLKKSRALSIERMRGSRVPEGGISITDAAKILGVSRPRVQQLTKKGSIKYLDGTRHICKKSLESLSIEREVNPPSRRGSGGAGKRRTVPPPSASQFSAMFEG